MFTVAARHALVRGPVLAFQHRRLLADPGFRERWGEAGGLSGVRISPRDEMYFGSLRQYCEAGLSALACVEAALRAAGLGAPERILDFPCGHGRVLRFLAARFPGARFTACDLNRDGVDFCAATFGARPAMSRTGLEALDLGESYDLIWCGSLFTHFDGERTEALLSFFRRHLRPGGLLVFSTHGRRAVENLREGRLFSYGLGREDVRRVLDSLAGGGFGYADYDARRAPGYGVSFCTASWMRKVMEQAGGLREVYYAETGWAGHHDVFGVVRADEKGAAVR